MAADRSAHYRRSAIAAAIAAAITFGFAASPDAAPARLRESLGLDRMDEGRQSATPQVAKYLIDEGGAFILDRTQPHPLLKFDDSPEVWVLYPVRGPRGDIIYKNDIGEPMLRATRLGGMTVFTAKRPGGAAAALSGSSSTIRVGAIGPLALYQRLFQASVRISRAVQHTVVVEAPDTGAGGDVLIADAAQVTVEALVSLASQPDTRSLAARVTKISFLEGSRSSVALVGSTLVITVVPSDGIAGRPSSRRIIRSGWGR